MSFQIVYTTKGLTQIVPLFAHDGETTRVFLVQFLVSLLYITAKSMDHFRWCKSGRLVVVHSSHNWNLSMAHRSFTLGINWLRHYHPYPGGTRQILDNVRSNSTCFVDKNNKCSTIILYWNEAPIAYISYKYKLSVTYKQHTVITYIHEKGYQILK